MKENEEKSTLNAYHIERNRLACLEVEEMMKHPSTLEEMREQTRQIMAGVTAEDRGIVFEIAGEGGDIQIIRKRFKKGFVYIYKHNESYFDEELTVNKTRRFYDFETPLKLIFKTYPVHCLYITTIHVDYKDIVIKELVWKLKTEKISQDNFCSVEKYEEKLNVKFEFNMNDKTWGVKVEQIDEFIEDLKKFSLKDDTSSYLISYPYFITYFKDIEIDKIGIDNLIIGIHFVYGWMPRVFRFTGKGYLESELSVVNKAKTDKPLTENEFKILKTQFDNSIVGVSKLLHFINPEKYAIWDSKVHAYLRRLKLTGITYEVNNISNYIKYLDFLEQIININEVDELYIGINARIKEQFGYNITKYRAIELVMFKTENNE